MTPDELPLDDVRWWTCRFFGVPCGHGEYILDAARAGDALATARAEERAAIVAWLRAHAFVVGQWDADGQPCAMRPCTCAEYIEAGAHRREEKRT